jgi:hypothetical protein
MAEVKLEHISKVYDDNKKSPDKKAVNDVSFYYRHCEEERRSNLLYK